MGAASRLGWTEQQFWRSTFYGLTAALMTRYDEQTAEGMTPGRLEELMKAYPDAP
jgi:hypothetical protein